MVLYCIVNGAIQLAQSDKAMDMETDNDDNCMWSSLSFATSSSDQHQSGLCQGDNNVSLTTIRGEELLLRAQTIDDW